MVSKMPGSVKCLGLQSSLFRSVLRFSSSHAVQIQDPPEIFRTSETSPLNHTYDHVGHYYKISQQMRDQLFSLGGIPGMYAKQTKTFTETCLMIRKPAIDVMQCIKSTNFDKPANRYLIYGEKGAGKSLQLMHLIHYAHMAGFLLVHVPWVSEWLRRTTKHREVSASISKEGFVDLPLDAAAWLLHFKTQNSKLLRDPQFITSTEYVWSKRESTAAGSTLVELIDHGINRIKYSSNVLNALLKEIKILSMQGKCKTFVAIDGYNTFFYPLTRLRIPSKKKITPFEVTLSEGFLDITNNNWKNGVIVLTVDEVAVPEDPEGSYTPRALLRREGFQYIDPFVPIQVKNYTPKEFQSCLSYYRNRLWLREPNSVDPELEFVSHRNPYYLMTMCTSL